MSCPMCRKKADTRFRPFCSKRCADLDLSKWFSGGYAVPSDDPLDAEQAIDEVEKLGAERPKLH
jgi:endogenous inhibitor of DNA gyrase (YacG/DUF329 family)